MGPHDPACLFCKIVAGQVPASKVFETDFAVAFLDIDPVNLGHVLLVPKEHHATLADLPDDLAARLGSLVPRLARSVQAATGADGLNLIVNNGVVAGQTVHHSHWHLIPRFEEDAVRWPWPHVAYEGDGLAGMRDRIALGLQGG